MVRCFVSSDGNNTCDARLFVMEDAVVVFFALEYLTSVRLAIRIRAMPSFQRLIRRFWLAKYTRYELVVSNMLCR